MSELGNAHFLLRYLFTTDALVAMEKAMKRDNIQVNDRQLACAKITSPEGQDYLKGMAAAANYAWVNRSSMTFLCRQVCQYYTCTDKIVLIRTKVREQPLYLFMCLLSYGNVKR